MDASHLADDQLDEQTANRVAGAYGLPIPIRRRWRR
jgi:hypothetical protein